MRRLNSTESARDSLHDTVRIPVLAELQQHFLNEMAADLGVDPYQSDQPQGGIRERMPRRTLDDMRRLSESIKRARAERTEQDGMLEVSKNPADRAQRR